MIYYEHVHAVKKSIQYIEEHLQEELSLERVATEVSFSRYHFHRIFQAHIGGTFSDYIRRRRLACIAAELLSGDQRILDIALKYRFESQEVLTRAFKRVYLMTPGQYRSYMHTLISRRESKTMENVNIIKEEPQGWLLSGSHPHLYTMGTDRLVMHQGKASGYLSSEAEQMEGFATMMQMFRAEHYLGKRLKLTGFVKTEGVSGWAGLWMRIDGPDSDLLGFDNMGNRPITGTTSWSPYSIVLDVPMSSKEIALGVLLFGKGKLWLDSVYLEEVDKKVPLTNIEPDKELPSEPVNLGFEL